MTLYHVGAALDITVGPDGALWFTQGSKIGRMTTSGQYTAYQIGGSSVDLYGITAGPDGALWVTLFEHHEVERVTTSGVVTNQWQVGQQPSGITAGPDQAVYFSETTLASIGRISMSGKYKDYTEIGAGSWITSGADGIWYLNSSGTAGRLTKDGTVTFFDLGPAETGNYLPYGIAAGHGRTILFSALGQHRHAGGKIGILHY